LGSDSQTWLPSQLVTRSYSQDPERTCATARSFTSAARTISSGRRAEPRANWPALCQVVTGTVTRKVTTSTGSPPSSGEKFSWQFFITDAYVSHSSRYASSHFIALV